MKATFEISGWAGTEEHTFEGNPVEIMRQFTKVQELECIYRMGYYKGEDEDVLDRLGEFLDKYNERKLTADDIKDFDFELPVGSFRCTGIEEEQTMKDERIIAQLSRSNDSGFSDSFIWTGTDRMKMKEFVKEIVLDDEFVKDILSDEPDMDHQEGLAEYIRNYFDDSNDTWEGISDFSIDDQGCSIDLYIMDADELVDELKDNEFAMTKAEYINSLDIDDLKEMARDQGIWIYNPDDVDDMIECLEDIAESQW